SFFRVTCQYCRLKPALVQRAAGIRGVTTCKAQGTGAFLTGGADAAGMGSRYRNKKTGRRAMPGCMARRPDMPPMIIGGSGRHSGDRVSGVPLAARNLSRRLVDSHELVDFLLQLIDQLRLRHFPDDFAVPEQKPFP